MQHNSTFEVGLRNGTGRSIFGVRSTGIDRNLTASRVPRSTAILEKLHDTIGQPAAAREHLYEERHEALGGKRNDTSRRKLRVFSVSRELSTKSFAIHEPTVAEMRSR